MDRIKASDVAGELEALVGTAPKGAASAQFGGIFSLVLSLAASIRGGDPKAIWLAFRAVVDALMADPMRPEFEAALQPTSGPVAALGRFNLGGLLAILAKILPLLFQ